DATVRNPAPATIVNTATVSGGGSESSSASDGGGAGGLADLSITKVAQPDTVPSGGLVTYTLQVQNPGPSDAAGVTVDDPLSAGSYRDISVDTTQGSCTATVSCSLGTVSAGSTVTITITATVATAPATLTNQATVSSSTPDPDPSNNSATATVTAPASADLGVDKTGPANPNARGADTFTVTVTNQGPDTATGVVVNDPLPAQFTATGASGGGFSCTISGGAGGSVVCTRASLAVAEGPQTITITGQLASGIEGQSIANAASVTSDAADTDLSNNVATLTQLVGPVADVSITKQALLSDGVTPVSAPLSVGDTFIYSLVVSNRGPSDASTVSVTDALPPGLALASTAAGCTPGAGSGGTITCALGTVGAGTSRTINLSVTVGAAAANTTPTNTASVSAATVDQDNSNNSASATVGVGSVANLALLKSASPRVANEGDLVTFTYTVTNSNPVGESGGGSTGLGTTGARITDPLPAGLQFVSASANCGANGATVTCDVGAVGPGETKTATVVARVATGTAGTTVINTASVGSVASGDTPALPELDPSDNSDAAAVVVNPEADLSLSKTVSNPSPATDAEVNYTLTARNAGPNDASNVKITDSLPAGLEFIDASPGCDNASGAITCTIATLASGDTSSVTIRARTTAAVAGASLGNLASVSAAERDPSPANNDASATINVQPLVDLDLLKAASNPTPTSGGAVSYTLTLVNKGPSPATGAKIADALPSGLSFRSAVASQGSCGASGQTVICGLGTLNAGATAIVVVTAEVAAGTAGGTLTNRAIAAANEPVARPALLSADATVRPTAPEPPRPSPSADLSITKTVNHHTGRTGRPLTYTITVSNHGPATAANPVVTDVFGAAVKIVSMHAAGGSCSKVRSVVCKLASLASGGVARITIVAAPETVGRLRNAAGVSSSTPDGNGANNLARVTTQIRPGPAALRITKSAAQKSVGPGQTFSFIIAVRSLGPEPALATQVCDLLGRGMMFVSTQGASFHRGRACWRISSLAKGKSRHFRVRVRADAQRTQRLTNRATASADGVRETQARATIQLVAPPAPAPPRFTG
ncbi:MAG: DUF11 domain-containing protein, partial [Solirubrobacterales bacterium]|nr:DUF11 domain-containing protein [Solirubrobacterales bacterium]